jgi:hypothetical protein
LSSYTNLANLYYEQYKDDLALFQKPMNYLNQSKIIKEKVSRNMAVFRRKQRWLQKALGIEKNWAMERFTKWPKNKVRNCQARERNCKAKAKRKK